MDFIIEKTTELKLLITKIKELPNWDEDQANQIINLINAGADYTIKTKDTFKNSLLLLAILRKSSKLAKFILKKDLAK